MEVANRTPTELSYDLDILEAKLDMLETTMRNTIAWYVFEKGTIYNHVKKNDLTHGQFGDWLKKRGESWSFANKCMNVVNNLNPNSYTSTNLGLTALDIIATMQPEQREIEHEVVEVKEINNKKVAVPTGKFKLCKDMTVKELRNVKKVLEGKIEVIEGEKEKLVASNNKLTSENSKLESANKKLNSQVDRLVDENDDLHDELSKKPKEVIVEKEVEKIVEVIKEVKVQDDTVEELYENYKLLSDELNRTQEKLLQYEKGEYKETNYEKEIKDNILEINMIEFNSTLKKLTEKYVFFTEYNLKKLNSDILDEFVNNATNLVELLEEIIYNVGGK